MTRKILPLLVIFIIIMFLSVNSNFIGGNFLKDVRANKLFNNKRICSNEEEIMKLLYNKNSCVFVDILNRYTPDKSILYLKKKYTNTYTNIDDNIINIYCKLYMPLNIIISNPTDLEDISNKLFNLLKKINTNFIKLDYFKLHNIYKNNKEEWYRIYKKHKFIYKSYSIENYKISITEFLMATINPEDSNIYNKLYYNIKKKINSDKDIIYKSDELEKEKIKNKSFSEFYSTNKDIIIKKLLFSTFDNIDNRNNILDELNIITYLIHITNYISKNHSTQIVSFSNDLLIFKKNINKKTYNLLFDNFKKELMNNQFIYNNLCKTPFFKNNLLSCPSKISLHLKTGKKIYSCNDEEENKKFSNNNSNQNKCGICEYNIKDCKINLKCKDAGYNNDDLTFHNIDPSKKYTNILQNRCMLNTSTVNLINNNVENEIKKQQLSNYNKKLIFSKPKCINKTQYNIFTNSKRFVINHICHYIKNNNIYDYFYINKNAIDDISDRFMDRITNTNFKFNDTKRSVGYTTIKTSTNTIFINYLFKQNETISTNPNGEKYHLISTNQDIIQTKISDAQGIETLHKLKKLVIHIGEGGEGGIYENHNNINICPKNGGNTEILFEVVGQRDYSWYINNDIPVKLIAYGGNVNNKNNIYSYKKPETLRISQNNKGTIHKFYKKYNICAGSGGGTINQLNDEFKLTKSNTIEEPGNRYNKKELFEISSKKYYLYQKNDSSYHITSNKNEIIDYPSGGDGGSLQELDGDNSPSYGCGGGSGAKKIFDSEKKNVFGNGGNGRKGAVIIMNRKGDILFNSTLCDDSINNINITINTINEFTNSNLSCNTGNITINLYNNEIFYIIAIGGGGGGAISGYSGNAGNIIVSRYCNFNIDTSTISDTVQNDYKSQLLKSERKFNNNIKDTILNSINNTYTGFNYNYEKIRNNFINIDSDKHIIDQTKYNNITNIACLYNTCLSNKNIIRETDQIHELYSINNNKTHSLVSNVQFKKTQPFVSNVTFYNNSLELAQESDVLSYYTNNYMYLYKKTQPTLVFNNKKNIITNSSLFFKKDDTLYNKLQNTLKITNELWFLCHQSDNVDNFKFLTKKNNKINTENLWINHDIIRIESINNDTNTFKCVTNIKPTGNDIICSIKLNHHKIDDLYNITDLNKKGRNKTTCKYISKTDNYCGNNKVYNEEAREDVCDTPYCDKTYDLNKCCKLTPQKCSDAQINNSSMCNNNMRWKSNLDVFCKSFPCDTKIDKETCCEYIPNKCSSLNPKTDLYNNQQFYTDYPHWEYDPSKANNECSTAHNGKCHPPELINVDDLTMEQLKKELNDRNEQHTNSTMHKLKTILKNKITVEEGQVNSDLKTCSKKREFQKCKEYKTSNPDVCKKIRSDKNNDPNKIYTTNSTETCGSNDGNEVNHKENWKCDFNKPAHINKCCNYNIPKCSDSWKKGGPNIQNLGVITGETGETDETDEIRNNWCKKTLDKKIEGEQLNYMWNNDENNTQLPKYFPLPHTVANDTTIAKTCCKRILQKCSSIADKETFCSGRNVAEGNKGKYIQTTIYDINKNDATCNSLNCSNDNDTTMCCKDPEKTDLIKCKNFQNCGLYKGLSYTADAYYKNVIISNIFETEFETINNGYVKFKNTNDELSYDFDYVNYVNKIYTPFIYSFTSKFLINNDTNIKHDQIPSNCILYTLPETEAGRNKITNEITINGKINANIKEGMVVNVLLDSDNNNTFTKTNSRILSVDHHFENQPKIILTNSTYEFNNTYVYLKNINKTSTHTTLTFGCSEVVINKNASVIDTTDTQTKVINELDSFKSGKFTVDYTNTNGIFDKDDNGHFKIREYDGSNGAKKLFNFTQNEPKKVLLSFSYFGVKKTQSTPPGPYTMNFYFNKYYIKDHTFIWEVTQSSQDNKWNTVPYDFCCSGCESNSNNDEYISQGKLSNPYSGYGRKSHDNNCFGKLIQTTYTMEPHNLYKPFRPKGGSTTGGNITSDYTTQSCELDNPLGTAECVFRNSLIQKKAKCSNIKDRSSFCKDKQRGLKKLNGNEICNKFECSNNDPNDLNSCCDSLPPTCASMAGVNGFDQDGKITSEGYKNWHNKCSSITDSVPNEENRDTHCNTFKCENTSDLNNCCDSEYEYKKCTDHFDTDKSRFRDKDKIDEMVNSNKNSDNCYLEDTVPYCSNKTEGKLVGLSPLQTAAFKNLEPDDQKTEVWDVVNGEKKINSTETMVSCFDSKPCSEWADAATATDIDLTVKNSLKHTQKNISKAHECFYNKNPDPNPNPNRRSSWRRSKNLLAPPPAQFSSPFSASFGTSCYCSDPEYPHGCDPFRACVPNTGGGQRAQSSRIESDNIPNESNLKYNILNGNDIVNYAGIEEKGMKGGSSDILKLDPDKNQIVIQLKHDDVTVNEGLYTYEAVIYNDEKINTMYEAYLKDINVNMSSKNENLKDRSYSLVDICKYLNTDDKLEITNLYDYNLNNSLHINESISINYDLIYIIPITTLLNDYILYKINDDIIRNKYIELNNKYSKSSYEFYFTFNTSSKQYNVFSKNHNYDLTCDTRESFNIKIRCIDNVDIYDIILINKSKKTDFEMYNIYKMNKNMNVTCSNEKDLFNIKKDDTDNNTICCNIPVLDTTITTNCTNGDDTSLCWHKEDPLECKINYLKILDKLDNKFYFSTDRLPSIGSNPIRLKVDIFRDNIMMKSNIKVEINKNTTDISVIKNKTIWLLGNPYTIENTNIKIYSLISDDLKLFENTINIKKRDAYLNGSSFINMSSLLYSTINPIIIDNTTPSIQHYKFQIAFKYMVSITNFSIYASAKKQIPATQDFYIQIKQTNVSLDELYDFPDDTWENSKKDYKLTIDYDWENLSPLKIFNLTFQIPGNVRLDLYNFSIQGKQVSFPKGFGEGEIKLLESTFKIKKNDTIILKKNI